MTSTNHIDDTMYEHRCQEPFFNIMATKKHRWNTFHGKKGLATFELPSFVGFSQMFAEFWCFPWDAISVSNPTSPMPIKG